MMMENYANTCRLSTECCKRNHMLSRIFLEENFPNKYLIYVVLRS